MPLTNPRILPFEIAGASGTLTSGSQIKLDNTGFTGMLASVTNTQAMAAIVDALMPSGGTPGMVAGTMVSIDDSTFSSVDADNAQEVASELERLFNIVASGQPSTPMPGLSGPFIPFANSVNVDTAGVSTYAGNIALYARSDNARVNFILPTDAEITASGVATDEQVEITVLNQAGTGRFDTGFTPTNTVIIDVEGANNIRRNTETGTLLNFIEAHQNDLVTLTQAERGRPWVAVRATLSNAALLLPSGLFRLQVGTQVSLNPVLGFIAGLPSGVTPSAGDAYQVRVGNSNFGGYGVEVGDVIVALQDNPSRIISTTNDDWLVIRNATNDIISLAEIHFLNATTETDTFTYERAEGENGVQETNVWLSPFILDHAPFLTPSIDPNNPQAGETDPYIGGRELDGTNYDFRTESNAFGSHVYVDIDGTFDASLINDLFLEHVDLDGNIIERLSLSSDFRPITLTGSTDTYYVFDDVGATDNFSSIHYAANQTLNIVHRVTNRSFSLSSAINVLSAIADGSITLAKLEPNVQALIQTDHSISAVEEAKLAGLEDTTVSSDIPDHTVFYQKIDTASATNDLTHYLRVEQLNGILPNYERTTDVFLLVPQNINLTGLERAEDSTAKVSVVSAGTISTTNGQTWQAYTATLPAVTGANSVLDFAYVLDGQVQTTTLSGAQSSFKIDRDNLSDAVATWIRSLVPDAPDPTSIPENLQQFGRHLTINTDTSSGWSSVTPQPIRADLARQFAAFWDEDRRTFTGNYFQDITGVDVIGFQGNNIFYYPSPTDPHNRIFQGAQSYILNSNVRIRNTAGGAEPISEDFTKIISFNYAIDFARIDDDASLSMLRVGPTASTPAIGLSGQEGLFLNIGRMDGGQRSRTYSEQLQVDGGHWHSRVDETVNAEAEIIIPQSKTGAVTVQIDIQLDDDGNDEGTHEETVTINNVGADQNLGQRTFSFSGFPSVTVNLTYEHDNNDLSQSRRVIMVRPTQPFNNAALTYNVSAHDRITETWNVSTTYARDPINAGSGHDDFGLFDPHLWETELLNHRNRVILAFGPYRRDDTDTDPEMAVRVVVDGELHGDGDPIRLHRPASDFTFDDMNFGNNNVAIAHIQVYDYDGPMPSGPEMLRMYNAQDRWLGAFWPPGHAVDDVVIDAHVEVTAGHGIIITDSATSARTLLEIDNGAIKTTVIT